MFFATVVVLRLIGVGNRLLPIRARRFHLLDGVFDFEPPSSRWKLRARARKKPAASSDMCPERRASGRRQLHRGVSTETAQWSRRSTNPGAAAGRAAAGDNLAHGFTAIDDPNVTEIIVNEGGRVWFNRMQRECTKPA